jgi:Ni/Co efflux regulator RcnB
MRHLLIAISAAAVLGAPMFAAAQTKQAQTKDQPGHSESAPGQRATKPGEAKKYAPGQQEQNKDRDKLPGAEEYAPGHQPK